MPRSIKQSVTQSITGDSTTYGTTMQHGDAGIALHPMGAGLALHTMGAGLALHTMGAGLALQPLMRHRAQSYHGQGGPALGGHGGPALYGSHRSRNHRRRNSLSMFSGSWPCSPGASWPMVVQSEGCTWPIIVQSCSSQNPAERDSHFPSPLLPLPCPRSCHAPRSPHLFSLWPLRGVQHKSLPPSICSSQAYAPAQALRTGPQTGPGSRPTSMFLHFPERLLVQGGLVQGGFGAGGAWCREDSAGKRSVGQGATERGPPCREGRPRR